MTDSNLSNPAEAEEKTWNDAGPGDLKIALQQERAKRQALEKEVKALREKVARISEILAQP